MILVGRLLSPFVRRCAVSLRLLGIEYLPKPLSVVDDRDELLRLNPLGRVPALVLDNDDVLIDSAAILDHLDECAGPERALVPASGADRRAVLKLLALAVGVTDKAVSLFHERHRRPADKQHDAHAEQCQAQIVAGLAALEAAFVGPYLAGERLTQADVTTVAAIDFLPHALDAAAVLCAFPRLTALHERCSAMPAFAATRP